MKTKVSKGLAAVALTTGILFLNSCQKEVVTNPVNNHTAAYTTSDKVFFEAMNVMQAAIRGDETFKTDDVLTCADVTYDTLSMPRVITVDYGAGCTNGAGEFRTGVITFSYTTEHATDPGANVTFDFDNVTIDGDGIDGTLSFSNNGVNGNGYPEFQYSTTLNVTTPNHPDFQSLAANATLTYEWIDGTATSDKNDDRFHAVGGMNGTFNNGNTFSATVQVELLRSRETGCNKHFLAGILNVQETGQPDKTIDYGNGTCDDLATVTVNGQSTIVNLGD